MSRPIPEGVSPCEHCDGTGHDGFDRSYPPNPYICEDCDGSGIEPETKKERCPNCHHTTTDGICGLCGVLLKPYAADRESEVARLNQTPMSLEDQMSEALRNLDMEDPIAGLTEANRIGKQIWDNAQKRLDDNDALIRELVSEWEEQALDHDDTQRVLSKKGNLEDAEGNRMAAWAFRQCANDLKEALARTTCPEAFDGCSENSTS